MRYNIKQLTSASTLLTVFMLMALSPHPAAADGFGLRELPLPIPTRVVANCYRQKCYLCVVGEPGCLDPNAPTLGDAIIAHNEIVARRPPLPSPCLPYDPSCSLLPPQGTPFYPLPPPPVPPLSMEQDRERILRQGEEHCRIYPQDTRSATRSDKTWCVFRAL